MSSRATIGPHLRRAVRSRLTHYVSSTAACSISINDLIVTRL